MTAIRATVADITGGEFGDEDGPRVISPYGVELRRVCLIGNITDRIGGNENFASITLDDGTGSIRAKAWGAEASLLDKVDTDSLVLLIGKIRQYNDEIYITPEIVRSVTDPNIMILHKYERHLAVLRAGKTGTSKRLSEARESTLDTFIESAPQSTSYVSKGSDISGLAEQILAFIKEHDTPNGVSIDRITEHFKKKGIDSIDVNYKIIELQENEKILEHEVGVYRPV